MSIPREAVADVLVPLATTAAGMGKMPCQCNPTADAYVEAHQVLFQLAWLSDVGCCNATTVAKRGSIMMTDAKKDAIRIVNRTIVKEVGDRVEVEWQLSATPELEWAEIFQLAVPSDRQGSSEWVEGGSPDVIGAVIRWFVPSEEIEEAEAEVQHRLNVANERTGSGPR